MSRYVYLPGAIIRMVLSAWIKASGYSLDSGVPAVLYRLADESSVPPYILVHTFYDEGQSEMPFIRTEQCMLLCVVSQEDGRHGLVSLQTFIADMLQKDSAVSELNRFITLSESVSDITIPYRFKTINIVGSDDEKWDDQGQMINGSITFSYEYTYQQESLPTLNDGDYGDYL